jgi:hypothetical protein
MLMTEKQDCPYKEKIEQHEKEIDRLKHGDWYDNKQLFETMMAKFEEVSIKMDKMNKNMVKYNGLIEKRQEDRRLMENNKERINKMETAAETKDQTNKSWKDNIHWVIYILIFLGGVATRFLPGG